MIVFVINKHGQPLMPCKPRKARKLLEAKKAKIVKRQPFTIQLLFGSRGYTQKTELGVDLGAKHVGVAITSEDKVLAKGEIELRQDVHRLMETRKIYRRNRRNRKTRYRKPRFLNRRRPEGWLPPSIESRVQNTFNWIDQFKSLLPKVTLHLEVGKFNVAKLIDPTINGVDYQHGQTYGYYDVRYFVFARDNYTCQVCHQKGKVLHTHHILYKNLGGTDRADNLISVCTACHTSENHKPGHILWQWMKKQKKVPQYKAPTFMNVLRRWVFATYPDAVITYGSETTPHRKALGLEKTHANDAVAITGMRSIKSMYEDEFFIKQFRKKKRSLHEATARKGRKNKNTTQKRNVKNKPFSKGIYLNDEVIYQSQKGFVSGFVGSTMVYLKGVDGQYLTHPKKSYKQVNIKACRFVRHHNNWQFIPHLRSS